MRPLASFYLIQTDKALRIIRISAAGIGGAQDVPMGQQGIYGYVFG